VNAYIYAAGQGHRLGNAFQQRAKILLDIGGRSLLEWHALRLSEAGIGELRLIVGYQEDEICRTIASLKARYAINILPIRNNDYTEGSVLSVHASLPWLLQESQPMLLMDGDVLYPTELLRRLIQSPHRTALLIDRHYSTTDDDPVLVPVRNGRPVEFRKRWTGQADLVGESIGFFKVDPADLPALEQATLRRGTGERRKESYDEIIRDMVLDGRFGFEDVSGMAWTELDFPSDVEYALQTVLPRLGP
jgi:L-glutamine-phosphate cytidylyltransferase